MPGGALPAFAKKIDIHRNKYIEFFFEKYKNI